MECRMTDKKYKLDNNPCWTLRLGQTICSMRLYPEYFADIFRFQQLLSQFLNKKTN